MTIIFSRNHQPRRMRLLSSFMLTWCRFVRRNFIGHHGWNGRESTNQLRWDISHIKPLYLLFYYLMQIHALLLNDVPKIELYYPVLKFPSISPPLPHTWKKNYEFYTDAFEEMLALICKCRSSKKIYIFDCVRHYIWNYPRCIVRVQNRSLWRVLIKYTPI